MMDAMDVAALQKPTVPLEEHSGRCGGVEVVQ
jgi:hypothetical protein